MEKVILIILMLLCSININAQFTTETIVKNDTTITTNETVTIKERVVYLYKDEDGIEANLDFYFVNDTDSTIINLMITDNEGNVLYGGTTKNWSIAKESCRGNVNYYIYQPTKEGLKERFKIGYLTTLKKWLVAIE